MTLLGDNSPRNSSRYSLNDRLGALLLPADTRMLFLAHLFKTKSHLLPYRKGPFLESRNTRKSVGHLWNFCRRLVPAINSFSKVYFDQSRAAETLPCQNSSGISGTPCKPHRKNWDRWTRIRWPSANPLVFRGWFPGHRPRHRSKEDRHPQQRSELHPSH